jgi:protocatechuate 3,4-dioxygenase beta subunit
MQTSRRDLLQKLGLLGAAGLLAPALGKANQCILPTPKQTEGPFYPVRDQLDKDSDLTTVKGNNQTAKGKLVIITGTVMDTNCEPIKGALVDIWQACESGRYNHPDDTNAAPLDPNFQYWGKAFTNELGQYQFKTIIPGQYPANESWIRPAHVHYKVSKKGFVDLTTQMYFKGDKYNDRDAILMRLTPSEREQVVVDFSSGTGVFDITLQRLEF